MPVQRPQPAVAMECAATGEPPISRVEREIGLERLQAAAALGDDALAPIDQQQLDVLLGAYAHLRPAMHAVLSAVDLQAATATEQALLATARRVAGQRGRVVDERVEVLPTAWRAWVLDDPGRVQRTRFELGLWYAARDALRAGRVFRPIGRRYADPAAFLLGSRHHLREIQRLVFVAAEAGDVRRNLRQPVPPDAACAIAARSVPSMWTRASSRKRRDTGAGAPSRPRGEPPRTRCVCSRMHA